MKKYKRIGSLLLLCGMFVLCLAPAFSSHASVGTVTAYRQITWGLSSGLYHVNDIPAFCSEYKKDCPTVGTQILSFELCENPILRKALYYGYNGPGNVLGMDEEAFILTSIAISNANIGETNTGVKEKYDVFYWDLVNHSEKYPEPPERFKAYLAHPAKQAMQRLAFYVLEERGFVEVLKKSANPEVTEGNSCYSLEGATYTVYSEQTVTEKSRVGTLVTDKEGKSNSLELAPGTYYIKETKAPSGYAVNKEVRSFEIRAEEVITLEMLDDPQVNPISLLLQKEDVDNPSAEGLGGAEFLVNYYPSYEIAGIEPVKTWRCVTDNQGRAYLNETVPLGTITIQEIKAPKGYQINPDIFERKIYAEGEFVEVHSYDAPIVKEEKLPPYQLVVYKKDTYGNQLEGAEFSLYEDEKCQVEVAKGVTNTEGKLIFPGLEVCKTYYLKETKAPDGYLEDDTVYKIYTEESADYSLEVINKVDIVLPKTGSAYTVGIPLMGILLCSISLYTMKKKRRKEI